MVQILLDLYLWGMHAHAAAPMERDERRTGLNITYDVHDAQCGMIHDAMRGRLPKAQMVTGILSPISDAHLAAADPRSIVT